MASGDSVRSVARSHGLSPQLLFGWRRQLRDAAVDNSKGQEVKFVPAVVDVPAPAAGRERKTVCCKAKADTRARRCDDGIIEIEGDGITIRAGRGADPTMIGSIVQALKASRWSGAIRVMVAIKPVDFRNGMEGRRDLRPWCSRACGQTRSRELSMCSGPSGPIGSSWCSGTERVCVSVSVRQEA